MSKSTCEGVTKKCGASYGVHTYAVELNGRGQGNKILCSSCRTTMEHGGYTLTQLADVPEARKVKIVSATQPSSPAAWQSWLDKD
jgi:hypothetical protein